MFNARWVAPEAVVGSGMQISKNMLWDHLPDIQLKSMIQVRACTTAFGEMASLAR